LEWKQHHTIAKNPLNLLNHLTTQLTDQKTTQPLNESLKQEQSMIINNMTILMGGDAGQGLDSSGSGFCKSLARAGLQVFSMQDNRSRIRGGHNFYVIKTSDQPILSWT